MLLSTFALTNTVFAAPGEGANTQIQTGNTVVNAANQSDINAQLQKFLERSKELRIERAQKEAKNASGQNKFGKTITYKPDDSVRVIVEVKGNSLTKNSMGNKTSLESLEAVHQNVKSEMQKNSVGAEFKNEYYTGLNGFSAEVKFKDIDKIKGISNVKNVYIANKYTLDMDSSRKIVNADVVNENLKFKGEGTLVAIVDTGIDYTHPDFQKAPESPKFTKEEAKDRIFLSPIQDKYYTQKVVSGYDWADMDDNIIPDLKKGGEGQGHGTHVAGTVAANGAIKGVAPEAQLLAEKVFSDSSTSAYSDDIIAGMLHAVNFGADVINMSLGSDAGFVDSNEPEQKAVKYASDNGVVVAIAAGNSATSTYPKAPFASNPDIGLVSTPGVAPDAICVAAYENDYEKRIGAKLTIDNVPFGKSDGHLPYNEVSTKKGVQSITGTKEVVFVENYIDDKYQISLNGKDVKDKVVFVLDGKLYFEQLLQQEAEKQGALALIVAPNKLYGSYKSFPIDPMGIPAVTISQDDGDWLANQFKQSAKKVEIEFDNKLVNAENVFAHEMSYFSSWGSSPDLDFKPEIAAPGGKIYSTFPGGEYRSWDGTSMATPHVEGASALLVQYLNQARPDLTGRDKVEILKTMLMNTAASVKDNTNEAGTPYSLRQQGAGLMKIDRAIKTPVIAYTEADGRMKGAVELKQIGRTAPFTLTLQAFGDAVVPETLYYDVYATILTDKDTEKDGRTYLSGQTMEVTGAAILLDSKKVSTTVSQEVSIEKNTTKELNFELNLPENMGTEKFIEGYIRLVPNNKNKDKASIQELSIPYLGFYGDWNKPKVIDSPIWEADSYLGSIPSLQPEKDEYSSQKNASGTALYESNTNVPLGLNYDTYKVDENNIAISPKSGWNDKARYGFTLLRNAKRFQSYVEDSNGQVIKKLMDTTTDEELSEGLRKNVFGIGDYNYISYQEGFINSTDYSWLGTDENGKTVEDGQYYLVFESTVDYPGAAPQKEKMPVKVDKVSPKLSNIVINTKDNTISWTGSDDYSGIQYYDVFINGSDARIATKTSLEVPKEDPENGYNGGYNLKDSDSVVVIAHDYAGNTGVSYVGNPVLVEKQYYDDEGNSRTESVIIAGNNIGVGRPATFSVETRAPVDWTVTVSDPFKKVVKTFTLKQQTKFAEKWEPEDRYMVSGTYTLNVEAVNAENKKVTAAKTFEVRNYDLIVSALKTIGADGNEAASFDKGSQVTVKTEVINMGNSTQTALMVLKVTDSNNNVVRIDYVPLKDMPNRVKNPNYGWTNASTGVTDTREFLCDGIRTHELEFKLSTNAQPGTYKLKAYLWDGYETMNALSEYSEKTFEVK